jgi:type IV pilus assembly protein PilB
MSDASQGTHPDLHAIFGMDDDHAAEPGPALEDGPTVVFDRTVEVDRDAEVEPTVELDRSAGYESGVEPGSTVELDIEAERIDDDDAAVGLEREPAQPAGPVEDEEQIGITRPSRRGSSARFLTDVIVDLGLVSRKRVEEAIETSRGTGAMPERVLIDNGALTQDGLTRALAERYGLDHLDLGVFTVDMGAANLVSTLAAKRYQAVPVAFADKRTLLVAMADPSNVLAVDDIAIMTGYEVRVAVAPPEDIATLISRLDRLEDVVAEQDGHAEELEHGEAEVVDLRESSDDEPVIKLVNQIVAQAVEQGASDVHLSPDGREVRVRFRVDGVLHDATTVPRRMAAGVISRVKIMAELNIAEKRLPQDGRVGLTVDGRHVDLRVVTLPSVHGEAIVMRVLDKDSVVTTLDKLGMSDSDRSRFERACHETHGAVLVTGPTGSGKSTTLYAALQTLNTPEKNIITVEDPVEYEMDGLTQLQVSAKVGLTFAAGLRSMVRADPDVIMVGEIRDRETAQIAVESALTGHLVLSTLHTNDAPSAITRLIEMGTEPFLVASALDCVVAQRLARMLCASCKRRTIIPAGVLRENGYKALVDLEAYEPVGCRRCGGSGYRGRLGLYEVMSVTAEIRTLTLERRPAEEMRDVAVRQGMRRLRDDGLEKVKQGRTSIAEIARVIGSS